MKGKVKFFDSEKGFGFIKPDDGGRDLFVHQSGLIDQIEDDDEVTYEIGEGKKGPTAVDVRRV